MILDLFDKSKYVTAAEQLRRLNICAICPAKRVGVCTKCGCVINLKTKLKTEKCPLNKW